MNFLTDAAEPERISAHSVIIPQAANRNLECKARKACQTGWINTHVKPTTQGQYTNKILLPFSAEELKCMFTECLK